MGSNLSKKLNQNVHIFKNGQCGSHHAKCEFWESQFTSSHFWPESVSTAQAPLFCAVASASAPVDPLWGNPRWTRPSATCSDATIERNKELETCFLGSATAPKTATAASGLGGYCLFYK